MINNYIISIDDAGGALLARFDDITANSKCKAKVIPDEIINNGKFRYDKRVPITKFTPACILIGVKDFMSDISEGCVNSYNLVRCIMVSYHEERHLYQHEVLYTDKNCSDDVKDMARIQSICDSFPVYRELIYFRNPSEIDAEIYAMEKTKEYFSMHFLDEKGNPLIDAESNILSIINHSVDWYGNKIASSYDEALTSLKRNQYAYKYTYRDVHQSCISTDNSRLCKSFMQSKKYNDMLVNCEDYVMYDKIVYNYLVNNFQAGRFHYACLGDEADILNKDVRKHRLAELSDKFDYIQSDIDSNDYDKDF